MRVYVVSAVPRIAVDRSVTTFNSSRKCNANSYLKYSFSSQSRHLRSSVTSSFAS